MDKFASKKAQAPILVTGKDGAPIANREIRMTLKNHQFLFGCGAFESVALMKIQDEEKKAFFADRMEKWLNLFNFGTLPFYWGRYEPVQGQTEEEATMKAAKWLKEKGVTVKGHPLCWHTACANWLMEYDNKTIMDLQLKRIHRDVAAFKGIIDFRNSGTALFECITHFLTHKTCHEAKNGSAHKNDKCKPDIDCCKV